ncbi:uncharacterized protein LOC124461417 [Drosophila willistoni]|uniref:uncharacterized protein LOC124461417 n=1 Tax=Drosophila willistoni TaxID=7260 RepID=UPI001F0782C1|nr:uncharacterized protein LOC124461417 [Drosophila willistoni]
MALRARYKWSDLTDEQLLELFESVPSDVDMSSISSDDEDEDVAEALNTALEDVSTVSLMCSNIENNANTVQSHEPSRKTRKRPRSPLPVIEGATPVSLPSSGGFNGLGIESIIKEPSKGMCDSNLCNCT